MDNHYYKFRSLDNLKYFLDILINSRLYAARYNEFNDPMEGAYLVDAKNRDIINLLKTEKDKTRICSLSKDYKQTLLWSHYADGHKGCCFEVVPKDLEAIMSVHYVCELPIVNNDTGGRELLSHKSKLWEYEQEVRLFSKSAYCEVDIHRIIFGYKVKDTDYKFYRKLICSINPEIEVRKIKETEIDTGFDNWD